MRLTDRRVSDQEKIEGFDHICRMVVTNYATPIRKGFERASRMGECGYDLITFLRMSDIVVPGEPNEQQRMDL